MLSDDLSALAAHFREYQYDGLALDPEGVAALATAISQMALDAGALERHVVPPAVAGEIRGTPRGPEPAA